VNEVREIDIDATARELSAQVEHWNSRGSGFVIERVRNFVICITKFRHFHSSSYVPTPRRIIDKHCTVNVNNNQKCFVSSVLASVYPASDHGSKLYKYLPYEHTLKTGNLSFPFAVKDIPKFENLNPSISVNVLSIDDKIFASSTAAPNAIENIT